MKGNKLLIGLFLMANFLYWVNLYLYMPTLPSYVETMTANLTMVGLVLSMYGLWQAVLRIPVGVMVDASGWAKPFIIGGFAFAAAGAQIMGVGKSVGVLALGRALTGVAAATWVPITAVFSTLFPQRQIVVAMSLLMFSGSIGRMLATGVTGLLNDLGGYRLAFYLAAAAGLLAILFILLTKLERKPPRRASLRSFLSLATRADVILPTLMNTVGQLGNWAIIFSFLPILAQTMGATDTTKSLLMSSHIGAFTVGNLLNSFAIRHIRQIPILLLTFLLSSLGIAGAALAPSLAVVFICSITIGFANGFRYPTLMGVSIQRVEVSQRSTAMGVHQALYAIGMFAGPWLGGILADTVGLKAMFYIIAGVCLSLSYLLILLLAKQRG
jgi:MFS family permease